jgi:hypothetical protein
MFKKKGKLIKLFLVYKPNDTGVKEMTKVKN